ncbi:hypothetical protein [Streptomyces sp. NPDC002845]
MTHDPVKAATPEGGAAFTRRSVDAPSSEGHNQPDQAFRRPDF